MAYLGSTPTTQSFIAGTDYFNGTSAQVAFTLSRSVNSVNDIEVVVNNVEQSPASYSASGTTLTFSAAPSSGTGNIYVRYLSTTLQSITIPSGTTVNGSFGVSANSSSDALRITQLGAGNALVVEDSTNPDATPFVVDSNGNVQIGVGVNTGQALRIRRSGTADTAFQQESETGVNYFVQARFATDVAGNNLQQRKYRGTFAAPSIVANGDVIGSFDWLGYDGANLFLAAQIKAAVDGTPGTNDMPGRLVFSTTADGASTPTERMRLDSAGNLKFNSGYGSVATAYGCRAWVNFNGTGTVAIRASGNVSSITDNGVSDYAVNFATAMVDANYSGIAVGSQPYHNTIISVAPTASIFRFLVANPVAANADQTYVNVAIFR